MAMSTTMLCFALLVSLAMADYEFTVRFYEFRNPLGLQCGACESGGAPVCCDDVKRTTDCIQDAPFTCDTRFRFQLRPYGSTVDTAPNRGFPYYTPSNGGNSDTFNEGPGGFLALPNPFTITSQQEWTGKIQFFIDALDRAVAKTNHREVEAIINRFSVNLQLELGANFTDRSTYTGIYNISNQGFDMSFRVQCSENFYGSMCSEYCEPILGVYEGRAVCVQNSTRHCETSNRTTAVLYQGSFALAITLGILFGVSLVTNVILVIAVVVQQRNSKQKNNKPVTDRTCTIAEDMTSNAVYSREDSDLRSPDKLPQEAIYYVYENVASGIPLLNQGAYDYVDSRNHS